MPDLPEFRRKLDEARHNVRHLTVIGMRPNLTPRQKAVIAERTEQASARLRKIALDQKPRWIEGSIWRAIARASHAAGLYIRPCV